MVKNTIREAVITGAVAAFPEVENIESQIDISLPKHPDFGDFSTNLAMKLSKQLKLPPLEIAQRLVETLQKNTIFAHVEAMVPGFVNMKLASDVLFTFLKDDSLFNRKQVDQQDNIIVEYCSLNVAKHLHIGHLRNIACGEATHRIFSWMGYNVSSIDHVGDWGTQFGKIILAVMKWGNKEQIEMSPVDELNSLYVRFHDEVETHPELEDEAREVFKQLEAGNTEYYDLWKWIVDINQAYTNTILDDLNVTVEEHLGESFYTDKMDVVLEEMEQKGLLTHNEDGSLAVDFEKFGIALPSCLVRKKDGATLYHTRDLATMRYRLEHYQPKRIIYVVADDQSLHFKQLFAMVRLLGWGSDVELTHMNYGLVILPEGKMSTRKGRAVTAVEVLTEAKERAKNILMEKNVAEKDIDMDLLTKQIAYGALTYSSLSISTSSNLIFEWDKILTFEGNSAPYLQYVYARASSLLQKAGDVHTPSTLPEELMQEERTLMLKLSQFVDTLEALMPELRINFLTQYLYELAGDFNAFYNKVRVLEATGDERTFKVYLVYRTREVIEKGLYLLNIAAPSKM